MPLKMSELMDMMERLAPTKLAESWDNTGLILGRSDAEIGRILIALDVTDEVVDEAIEIGADVIVSHHPVIFRPIAKINDTDCLGRKILKIFRNHINVYAAHTNLDIAEGGTNDVLFELLGLGEKEYVISDEAPENKIGRAGMLKKPLPLVQYAEIVKKKLLLDNIRYCGDGFVFVRKVGICTGSGAKVSYFEQAKAAGCDTYITSDISFHNAQAALDLGLNLIDATHFASEVLVVEKLKNYMIEEIVKLNKLDDETVLVFASKVNGQVFKNIH